MVDGAGLSGCAQRGCFRTFPDNAKDLPGSLWNVELLAAQNKTTSPLVILFLEVLPKGWDSPTVVPPKL
jgi:hypothetical protein